MIECLQISHMHMHMAHMHIHTWAWPQPKCLSAVTQQSTSAPRVHFSYSYQDRIFSSKLLLSDKKSCNTFNKIKRQVWIMSNPKFQKFANFTSNQTSRATHTANNKSTLRELLGYSTWLGHNKHCNSIFIPLQWQKKWFRLFLVSFIFTQKQEKNSPSTYPW